MINLTKIKQKIRKYTYYLRVYWYYIEVYFSKFKNLLKIKKDKTIIPEGMYCYTLDEERQKIEPCLNGYWIKPCKYYRSMKGNYAGCTYVGYIGWDICLGDQCKICGENYGDERDPIIIERENKIKKILNRKK